MALDGPGRVPAQPGLGPAGPINAICGDISGIFRGYFRDVSGIFQRYFGDISGIISICYIV